MPTIHTAKVRVTAPGLPRQLHCWTRRAKTSWRSREHNWRKLLQHAYQTTPYYRELLKTESPDISEVPPLEKQNIREQLKHLCSEAFPQEQRIKNATGGSTGTPLTFYQDRNYWNQRNLSVYYFDRWAGWNFGEPQLIIWGSPADLKGDEHWKHRLNNFWRNQYWLNGFHLTGTAMQAAFNEMNRCPPGTILAYPSSLYRFATFLSEKRFDTQMAIERDYIFRRDATSALPGFS